MPSLPSVAHVVVLALIAAPGSYAYLRQPHQLSASGASAEANPEVDAWHDQEKSKIEAECDEMMRKLWAAKRQKLQDIVDALRKQVEAEKVRVAALRGDVNDEMGQLEKEKDDLAGASKKIPLGPDRDRIADLEARIRALEQKIAEKQACVDELNQAERDLAEALRRLAEAERKVADAKAAYADQVDKAELEASHVPPARADVEAAEDCLARAKARVAAARRRLEKAKGDLAEHDAEMSGGGALLHDAELSGSDALLRDAAPEIEAPMSAAPESSASVNVPPRSSANHR